MKVQVESKVLSTEVSLSKIYLSSETRVFKTERFFYQTKKLAGVDNFILKLAEKIQTLAADCKNLQESGEEQCAFKVETFDRKFSFKFVFGFCLSGKNVSPSDIVFYEDAGSYENLKSNDQRLNVYLSSSKIFAINIRPITSDFAADDFSKLFYVFPFGQIQVPMLDDKQSKLVQIENQNVLIQGVAGSGKTNICLSKIIYAMSRNYAGKVLYTTFSRGLLIDTKNKLEVLKGNIKQLIEDYIHGKIVFLDKNHIAAVENRLGIKLFSGKDENIVKRLEGAVEFFDTHVDFLLIEDIYKNVFGCVPNLADEKTFTEKFLNENADHQLKSKLSKLKNISSSIIYKEVYGLIFGFGDESRQMLGLDEYIMKRKDSFEKSECEIIYEIAKRYLEFQKTQNLLDNNVISRKLLQNSDKIQKYSLSIIDEVQDMTQINLILFHAISLKMFCVGDALQMINPTYFNFSFLKNLMYREDVTDVVELEYNYRNNKKIADIINNLSEINTKQFGTHNFVIESKSIESEGDANAVYVNDGEFLNKLKSERFENFTILCEDADEKARLREIFPRQEILSIAEVKGLERDTVLLVEILSRNKDKWEKLERINLSHKSADENSVYRYYFNLFYVGLSRAKHNIFVFESESLDMFNEFFEANFENLDAESAYEKFGEIVSKIEIDDDEIEERIDEFLKLGQFENARFYANKFEDEIRGRAASEKIYIYENFIFKGKNREAGIRFWKNGQIDEAKKQFEISGDRKLIEFLESLESYSKSNLDIGIVKYYTDFGDNEDAKKLILEIVGDDLKSLKAEQNIIKSKFKEFKKSQNG